MTKQRENELIRKELERIEARRIARNQQLNENIRNVIAWTGGLIFLIILINQITQ